MFKALLVDDEDAILYLFSTVLEMHSFQVVTASSAGEAIALLAQEKFDIVITDLRMETPLAGFDVVSAARGIAPRPVVAVLTAFPVPACDWKNAGADALYVKGVNPLQLPEQLDALLKQRLQLAGADVARGR